MICAICGLEITKVPNVYNKEKAEHYHHTCWFCAVKSNIAQKKEKEENKNA
jgi:hypothetical protein